ncbi:hypothetical protein SAMN05518683_111105 [Salibacterium halotolerans]|uniref:Uncharacterized protein n=1 Tax=Salibacterium halotolerans TaxID=1884432 RepID=A0A1I5TW98_9BACI|nr:hypothetical protein SAMN05518683_111105 [Salibacterium halotolerans]
MKDNVTIGRSGKRLPDMSGAFSAVDTNIEKQGVVSIEHRLVDTMLMKSKISGRRRKSRDTICHGRSFSVPKHYLRRHYVCHRVV